MIDTTFVAGTVVTKEWLNSVNDFVYNNLAVSPMELGAVGDGVTDDTVAVNAAITAAAALQGTVYIDRTYLVLGLQAKSNVKIIGTGNGKFKKNAGTDGTYIISGVGTLGTASAVTGTTALGASSVTVASSAGFTEGGYCILRDDSYVLGAAGRNQEILKITTIVGNVISFQRLTLASYSAVAQLVPLTPIQNFILEDVQLEIPTVSGGNVGGNLYLQYAINCSIKRNKFTGSGGDAAIGFDTVAQSIVTENYIADGQNVATSGYGYGIQFNEATHHCIATLNTSYYVREHTFTNRTRFCLFTNNICVGHQDNGFNTHGAGVTDCLIANNLFDGIRPGPCVAVGYSTLSGPDKRIDIVDNIMKNSTATPISVVGNVTHQNETIRVLRNTIYNCGTTTAGSNGISMQYTSFGEISDNSITGVTLNVSNGIFVANASDLVIKNNILRSLPDGYGITYDTITGAVIKGNDIRGAVSFNVRGLNTNTNIVVQNNTADDNFTVVPATGVLSNNNSWDTFSGSAVYDPTSLADGAGVTTTVTATGCVLGDFASAAFSLNLQGISLTAYVSAADTVSVRFQNESGGVIDLGSGTVTVRTYK